MHQLRGVTSEWRAAPTSREEWHIEDKERYLLTGRQYVSAEGRHVSTEGGIFELRGGTYFSTEGQCGGLLRSRSVCLFALVRLICVMFVFSGV